MSGCPASRWARPRSHAWDRRCPWHPGCGSPHGTRAREVTGGSRGPAPPDFPLGPPRVPGLAAAPLPPPSRRESGEGGGTRYPCFRSCGERDCVFGRLLRLPGDRGPAHRLSLSLPGNNPGRPRGAEASPGFSPSRPQLPEGPRPTPVASLVAVSRLPHSDRPALSALGPAGTAPADAGGEGRAQGRVTKTLGRKS